MEEPVGQRMIYEDDLRKACGKRSLEITEQHIWMAFRKRIPISQWVERNFDSQQGKPGKKLLIKELEDYHRIFSEEAAERGLELDMDRNYYSEAVDLLGSIRRPDAMSEEDRRSLTELMIMVDYKDARLGTQIVKSIL
ncbi:MAG: hypothetical protein JXQ83_00725 [Candidatus Glassbacteria bacterium]|nr:hypothetical protein [Candidatus Glassbacteria bacterium]